MKTQCPQCGKAAWTSAPFHLVRVLDGRRFAADLPARRCRECGEQLVGGPALLAFEQALALELIGGGSVGPQGFRFLRKVAGLPGKRLAELLDVTSGQVSRWENGHQSLERRAVALVSELAAEKLEAKPSTLAVLEALAGLGRKPARRVRLTLASVST